MTLYIRAGCKSCEQVLQAEASSIERLQAMGKLRVIDVTDHMTDLPATPALVIGQQVIIGTGITDYLRAENE